VIVRATTTPGLEDVARAEGERLLSAAGLSPAGGLEAADDPFLLPGVVCWALAAHHDFPAVHDRSPLSGARSLYHVAVHVAELAWDGRTLASLIAGLADVDLDEMRVTASFRVSCSRVGDHEFQSPEVEREAGSILQARYGTDVDLERYSLHVKIDVVGGRAFAGYQLTGRKGLDRRHPGAPALSGSDWDAKAVAGASANLREAGLDSIRVSHHDAQDLRGLLEPVSLDYIVTNPPFGIRLGKGANLLSMYRDFLAAAAVVLRPGGRLAMLVARRRGAFNKVLATFPEFAIEHVRVVEMGGVYAGLFVLRRTIDPSPDAE